jgi:hypothetical protein
VTCAARIAGGAAAHGLHAAPQTRAGSDPIRTTAAPPLTWLAAVQTRSVNAS